MGKNNNFVIEINQDQFKAVKDTYNSNVEVFVTLDDGCTVTIIVGTPKNFEYLMAKDQVNFYGPGLPWIIVKELTIEIIHEAIKAYIEDSPNGYWLKLYHFWSNIDTTVFDQLEPIEMDEPVQFNLSIKLDQLKTQLNKLNEIKESEKLNLIPNLNKLLRLLENFSLNSEKSSFQLDQQLTLAEKYLNFTKAILGFTSLLAIYQILEIFLRF